MCCFIISCLEVTGWRRASLRGGRGNSSGPDRRGQERYLDSARHCGLECVCVCRGGGPVCFAPDLQCSHPTTRGQSEPRSEPHRRGFLIILKKKRSFFLIMKSCASDRVDKKLLFLLLILFIFETQSIRPPPWDEMLQSRFKSSYGTQDCPSPLAKPVLSLFFSFFFL